MVIIAIVISVLAGVSIVFSRIFNSKMAEKMGLFQGALLNNTAGLIISGIIIVITGDYLFKLDIDIPLWAYFGGILGIGIVVLSSYLTRKVSVFYLTLLIFIGQLITGLVIDYFISHDMSLGRSIGGLLVIGGFIYNLKIDQKEEELEVFEKVS